ncbi:MAG TPA: IPT/TIG domain-containing protein, partial [Thermoanaerobaculia bacterium]|nr:IPT/TIG domain-containing protein [Thermoanaerobaculia bacterium]
TSVPSGITIDSITNSNGSISAYITPACDASSSNSIVLEVTDSGGLTATATFQVFVRSTLPLPVPNITAATNGTGTSDQACPEQPLVLTAHSFEATSYQWYNDGGPISGATGQTYSATSAGSYTATATNACYTTAQSFIPYVVQNPTPHRANLMVLSGETSFCTGGSVTLWSDSATGIQWYRDGAAIAGANHESYVATASGSYTVILNALGCHTSASDPVVVTVSNAPSAPIITASTNGTGTSDQACPEQPLLLVAHDSNSSLTNYQWYRDNDAIDGATSNQYSATASGDYSIVATLNGCSTRSNVITVQNPTPHKPTISVLSESTTICTAVGGWGVQLQSDSATGIQWYNNGFPISGANNQNLLATESGSYTVILNALGCHSQESDPVIITVYTAPEIPTITAATNGTGTSDQACPEQPLVLTANDSNPSSTSYQWFQNNDTLQGETSKTYTATAVGDYTIVATSADGCSVRSDIYTVHNPTPHAPFLSARSSTTFCTGGSVILDSNSATGIQWYRDGVAIAGAGSQSYTATVSGTYTVILNALGCHSGTSNSIVVTVTDYPSAPTVSGASDQACPEQPLTLTASATGATSYQWYRDDELLSGETNATLTVTAASSYSVTATNGTCTTPRSSGYAVQNPTPHSAFLSARSATTFCTGGSVILDSNSATGIQWYRDGVAIAGAGSQSYTATVSGTYTVILNALGCHSGTSNSIVVTVTDYPSTPTVTGTSDQACPEQPLTLTASATGVTAYQWYRDDELLTGETNATLTVTAASSYSVTATNGTCTTPRSSGYAVQNPTPHKATLSVLNGSATFCDGGSVTLWSDSATGIQWYRNGVAISGATQESYTTGIAGAYTVILNALGCHSTESDPLIVTVNTNPSATITAPSVVISSTTGNSASVALAGTGATYNWSITGGTITAGSGTNAITFTAGSAGTLTLSVTVTNGNGCTDTKSASVSVVDPVTVTNITPSTGSSSGGTAVTIKGTGFLSGATVTFGGTAATSVVIVSSTKITATTPAHAQGTVAVVVTNANTASGTLSGGFTYKKK